jgi:ribosome-associated translation inhibitor RaiA
MFSDYADLANVSIDAVATRPVDCYAFRAQPFHCDGSPSAGFSNMEDTVKTLFNYKQVESRQETEKEVGINAKRLEKFLKRFAPDLVQLHGAFERIPHKNSFTLSLNLSLPTGTLHATGEASDEAGSVRAAFAEILAQLKKHMGKLRKDYEWKRKRARRLPAPASD